MVSVLLDNLAERACYQSIMDSYRVTREDIKGPIAYAADLAQARLVPFSKGGLMQFKIDENFVPMIFPWLSSGHHTTLLYALRPWSHAHEPSGAGRCCSRLEDTGSGSAGPRGFVAAHRGFFTASALKGRVGEQDLNGVGDQIQGILFMLSDEQPDFPRSVEHERRGEAAKVGD